MFLLYRTIYLEIFLFLAGFLHQDRLYVHLLSLSPSSAKSSNEFFIGFRMQLFRETALEYGIYSCSTIVYHCVKMGLFP